VPLSTAANRYRSAFHLITGHDFTWGWWLRLMGPLKGSEKPDESAGTYARPVLRRMRSPAPRLVPDSVVTPDALSERGESVVGRGAVHFDDQEALDLPMDIETLIRRGLSDDAVARRLDLYDPTLVGYYRARQDEFKHIKPTGVS
jgi:hypothetical protein